MVVSVNRFMYIEFISIKLFSGDHCKIHSNIKKLELEPMKIFLAFEKVLQ